MTEHPSSSRPLRPPSRDAGFSLVEVVVAMVVLALTATGVVGAVVIVQRMSADNRYREVAINLAEQRLDGVRDTLDPTQVHNSTVTQTVGTAPNARVFTIVQATSWVNSAGADVSCGSSQNFSYKRVSETVTWTGMSPTTPAVESDTLLAPNGRTGDSTNGSIVVSVTGVTGTGESGVSVSVVPNTSIAGNTATTLTSQPAATDADGCSYAFNVVPGTYTVTINRANSVDTTQTASPVNSAVTVTAGATYSVPFTYDNGMAYTIVDASNVTSSPRIATNQDVTLLSTGTVPYVTTAGSALLYPSISGYVAIAGAEANAAGTTICAAEDPAQWPAGTVGTTPLAAGTRGTTVAAVPGGSGSIGAPMGTFTVTPTALLGLGSSVYVTAVAQNLTTNGNPGCGTPETYKFAAVPMNATTTLALPYGVYKLYSSSSLGLLGLLGTNLTVVPVTTAYSGGYVAGTGMLTLDPRPHS